MCRSMLALGGVILALVLASLGPLGAAELPIPMHGAYVHSPARCGRCGCLSVIYVYHRELETTYGESFDPRNYDTAEPHYYWGPVRRYPRYLVNGAPIRRAC
jgi:hypothetical protein